MFPKKLLFQEIQFCLKRQFIQRQFVTECDVASMKCSKEQALPGLNVTDLMSVSRCWDQPRVIIVGAGLAGLSAAQKFKQCDFHNFVILEANKRPGGRVNSYWMGDAVVELGAQWINGGSVANSIYNLASCEGLIPDPVERKTDNYSDETVFFTSDGRAIKPQRSEYLTFERIKKQAKALFSTPAGQKKGNLMHFFAVRMQQEILRYPEEWRYDAERIMCGLSNGIRSRWGEDLSNLSAGQFGSFHNLNGGLVRLPAGFLGITAPLLRNLPAENIKYNRKVDCISWGEDLVNSMGTRAVVKCCGGEQHCADYILITISLGVLKKHMDDLFTPRLPEYKREAINKLGYGHVTKVFLEYGLPWWAEGKASMKLAWSMDEIAERNDWKKGISSIEEVPASKQILVFSVGGPEARVLESCDENDIANEFTILLRKFTGDPTIPYPCNVLKTTWSSDDKFLGSFSFNAVGSGVGHRKDLSNPLPGICDPDPPILMFAGEATCDKYFSTAHGARMSGLREAQRILSLIHKFKGPPPIKTCSS